MRFKKVLSIMLVGVLCLTLFSGCGEENKNTNNASTTELTNNPAGKTLALVGENEDMGFYKGLKKGAEDAAKKYGYTLEFMGTDESTNNVVSSHAQSLEKAMTNGVSGVVITPNGEGYSEAYSKLYDKKIPVVQVDKLTEDDFEKLESNKKNPVVSTVSTSYKDAGAVCAEKLFEAIKEDLKKATTPFVIGVIVRDDELSDEEKADGFVEKFTELADADSQTKDKYEIETESESDFQDALTEIGQENIKAVFITHPDIADKLSDAVSAEKEKYKDIVFCGFDSGAKQLKWLKTENTAKFIGGVAQNAYDLGYNAVEQCVFAIEGKQVKESIEIEGQWYDKNNLDKMKQDNLVSEK